MHQRRLLPAQPALRAREVVEEARIAGQFVEELLVRLGGLVVILVREVDEPFRVPLPRRWSERLAGLAPRDDDRRPGFLGDGGALRGGVADEDERARRRVDLVPVHGERRMALGHEIELLVTARTLT